MISLGVDKKFLYIGAVLFVATFLTTGYYLWKRDIEYKALIQYNMTQMQQLVRDQQESARQQAVLFTEQQRLTRELLERNEALQRRMEAVNVYLASPQAQRADRPASEVIRETINQLRRTQR